MAEQEKRVGTDAPLTADFVAAFPDGSRDTSSYDDVETALDRAEAECKDGRRWLKLPERVAALANDRDRLAARVEALEAALQPFANLAKYVQLKHDDLKVAYPVKVADLRTAARALGGPQP